MLMVVSQRGIPQFPAELDDCPRSTRSFAQFDRIHANGVSCGRTLRERTLVKAVDTTSLSVPPVVARCLAGSVTVMAAYAR